MKASHVLIPLIALGLAACSVKADLHDLETPLSLPDVTGTWKSGCAMGNGGNYEIQTLELTQTTFKSSASLFNDSSCAAPVGSPITVVDGTYQVTGSDSFLANAFDMTLRYTDPSGNAVTGYTLMQFDENKMYLPSYMGLNPQSRPTMVDRNFAFSRQ